MTVSADVPLAKGAALGRILVALLNFETENRDQSLSIVSWGAMYFFFFFFCLLLFPGKGGGGGGGPGPGRRGLLLSSESLEEAVENIVLLIMVNGSPL